MTLVSRLPKISPRKEREHGIERRDRLSKERVIEEFAEVKGLKDRQLEGLSP